MIMKCCPICVLPRHARRLRSGHGTRHAKLAQGGVFVPGWGFRAGVWKGVRVHADRPWRTGAASPAGRTCRRRRSLLHDANACSAAPKRRRSLRGALRIARRMPPDVRCVRCICMLRGTPVHAMPCSMPSAQRSCCAPAASGQREGVAADVEPPYGLGADLVRSVGDGVMLRQL